MLDNVCLFKAADTSDYIHTDKAFFILLSFLLNSASYSK